MEVSGKIPPGKKPPGNKFPRKIAPRKIIIPHLPKKRKEKKIEMLRKLLKLKTYILPGKTPLRKLPLEKLQKKPWENKSVNKKYILYYSSYFAAVFSISEGIRNLVQQRLI